MSRTRTVSRIEDVPAGEPARYLNGTGYVRLRWLVGIESYVECYEHRLVAGFPPAEMDVHHRNHVKTDNRRENLQVLTKAEHAQLHQAENAAEYARRRALRNGYRSQEAFEKAKRAASRKVAVLARSKEMRAAYEAGMSTTELGLAFGLCPSNVSRHLRRIGTEMRPFGRVTS